ncbi:MAG: hypothetical protein DWI22_16305 [Planctomycetota bacterium]|jgi:hypothetical protein|nr:MAG: hypothetical protein DWI22_16305 [Planctomycetota bacterium]
MFKRPRLSKLESGTATETENEAVSADFYSISGIRIPRRSPTLSNLPLPVLPGSDIIARRGQLTAADFCLKAAIPRV